MTIGMTLALLLKCQEATRAGTLLRFLNCVHEGDALFLPYVGVDDFLERMKRSGELDRLASLPVPAQVQ